MSECLRRERERERERELPAKTGDQLFCSKNPTLVGETYKMKIIVINHMPLLLSIKISGNLLAPRISKVPDIQ